MGTQRDLDLEQKRHAMGEWRQRQAHTRTLGETAIERHHREWAEGLERMRQNDRPSNGPIGGKPP